MLTPVAMAVLTTVFTDRRERARAIGVRSAVQGITMALGPLLGGLLVDTAGWRWIFLINLPVGILAPAPTGKVPESRAPHPRRPDAAITTTGRQIGSALGVAVIGATLPATSYATTTFDHASRPAWWIITGCGITLAALAPSPGTAPARAPPPGAAPRKPTRHRPRASRARRDRSPGETCLRSWLPAGYRVAVNG
ncbi:MFS transporter [Streptomyces sp. x-80]|uniref:MFS transporter n=1 Tax=Streptomyces sp. x-80 TaxID=2789282 RepID=UPI00397EB9A5